MRDHLNVIKNIYLKDLAGDVGINLVKTKEFDKKEEIVTILQKIGLLQKVSNNNDYYRFSDWIHSLNSREIMGLIEDFEALVASEPAVLVNQWERLHIFLRDLMTEKYDPGLIKLTTIMQSRFDTLKTQSQKGFVFDVDGNLTTKHTRVLKNGKERVEARLTEEVMEKLYNILKSTKPVVLITGRMTKVDESVKDLGESDLETILAQLRTYIDAKKLDSNKKTELLNNLYLISENGLGQITNGFREGEFGFKRYDEKLFPRIIEKKGLKNTPDLDNQITKVLQNIDFQGMKLTSERMFKFRGNPEELPALRQQIIERIHAAGLWVDSKVEVVLAGEVIDVLYYPVNKFSSLVFLKEESGLEDDQSGVIIKSGDNADPLGNDYPLVSRPWGISSGKYDPFNPYMVALPLISGQKPGVDSTLWALEELKL